MGRLWRNGSTGAFRVTASIDPYGVYPNFSSRNHGMGQVLDAMKNFMGQDA